MESLFITTSGGILTNQMIDSIGKEQLNSKVFEASTYELENEQLDKKHLEENILTVWELLCIEWDKIALNIEQQDIRKIRNKWIIPLLELLGYNLKQLNSPITVGDEETISFPISHIVQTNNYDLPVHIVTSSQDLDKKDERTRYSKRSPHDLLQQYLNTSKTQWGIVTNGKVIRLLKEHHLSYTKGYIEFNLAGIFESRRYKEFKILYRLLHITRFNTPFNGYNCIMDNLYEQSITNGSAIGAELKINIKKAIEELGNGFLNGSIVEEFQNNEHKCCQFYSELLIIIYRVMFLLFAEQRGLFPGTTSLYMEEYSITSLRNRVEKGIPMRDEYTDIWEGLKVTFEMVEKGIPEQGIYAYNGMLFSAESTQLLNTLQCRNREFLKMIDYLTLFNKEGMLQRISYVDLGVEELGSIYENLLDFTPRVTKVPEQFKAEIFGQKEEISILANTFFLDPRGTTRKQSGSYYTPPELVDELIKSALIPTVQERLKDFKSPIEKEKKLLEIKVCDPACGSGHFLIAANNYLGMELAKIRSESEYPSNNEIALAKRDALIHCIYGVDINPMAVELAKVSLWINACVREYPLNFLDHHIKCGNSLIGTTSELIKQGIPTKAFDRDDKEEKKWSTLYKNKNKKEKEEGIEITSEELAISQPLYKVIDTLELKEDTPNDVHIKTEHYKQLRDNPTFKHLKLIYDMWVTSFYAELGENQTIIPTESIFQQCMYGPINTELEIYINALANNYKFFHWEIEFPEVFQRTHRGFDCILGNPPWETVVLKEKEFFVFRDKEIFEATTAAKRKELIEGLKITKSNLYENFKICLRDIKSSSHYIRKSGKYEKSAKGTLNTYAIFTDLARQLVADNGRLGIITETGLATNDGTKELFGEFINNNTLISLIDFENREKLFPIDSRYRFCLLTAAGLNLKQKQSQLLCYANNMNHLQETERYFYMTSEEFELVNPQSRTMPSCKTNYDKQILVQIYNNCSTIGKQYKDLRVKNMFHMSGDSKLFLEQSNLIQAAYDQNYIATYEGNRFLPLYEAKLFHQYVFNFATFEGIIGTELKNGQKTNYIDNSKEIVSVKPRYWINQIEVKNNLINYRWKHNWILGIRSITCATNERTSIASILPIYGGGHSIGYVVGVSIEETIVLLFCLNSFIFDYVARMKVGGMNFSIWILLQQPIISYEKLIVCGYYEKVKNNILKLTYYHEALKPFAVDLGYECQPFKWNENERLELKCELDAIAAKLYGISNKQLDYILETFNGVKNKDIDKYGHYRTKQLILDYFNLL